MTPGDELNRIADWIDRRDEALPEEARAEIRYQFEAERARVTLVEMRAPWRPDFGPEWSRQPFARLNRHSDGTWELRWFGADGRSRAYEHSAGGDIEGLLGEVDVDPWAVFFG